MFRMRQRKADDFDEGRAADSVLGKPRPVLGADSGPQFPKGLDRENPSPSLSAYFRDAVSAGGLFRKARPVLAVSEWDALSP